MPRPRPLRTILWLQAFAIPLSLGAGFLAAIAASSVLGFLAGVPAAFYSMAAFFMVAAPVTHAVFIGSLVVERGWAWQRAVILAWVLLVGEAVFIVAGSFALEWTLFFWLSPLIAIGVTTVVFLRHPLVVERLDTGL